MKRRLIALMLGLVFLLGMVGVASAKSALPYTSYLPKDKLINVVLNTLNAYGWPDIKYSTEKNYITTGYRLSKMNHALWLGTYGRYYLRYEIKIVENGKITNMEATAIVRKKVGKEDSSKRAKKTEGRMLLWLFKVVGHYSLLQKG